MTDIESLKSALVDICRRGKGKNVLFSVNNKRTYLEIAREAGCSSTQASSILNKARTFGLLTKDGDLWKKTPEFRHLNMKSVLKTSASKSAPEERITVKKRKKIVVTDQVKKSIMTYFLSHFSEVKNPFSESTEKIDASQLKTAAAVLFKNLDSEGPDRLKDLAKRFYESFSSYASCDRLRKEEITNDFRSLILCFEPYVKKVAAIKTGNPAEANPSLSPKMISKIVTFGSNLDENKIDYWKDKPVHEASIRVAYRHRHIESHEARDYPAYEMDRIVFYMFASIIFINLDY